MTEHQVSTEFVFDRASGQALAHAYRVLVPERRARSAQRRDDDDRDQTSRTDRGARPGSSWSPSTTKDKTARPSGPEARTGRARA